MEVVERKAVSAVDVRRRQQLPRRPVFVHEDVISRLQTCERKKEFIKGSGLRYLLDSLNTHCHQFNPPKLVEALRLISDNQLFDRRSIYNLFDAIARNLLYFAPSQHRTIIDSISKCMVYTVQNITSLENEKCDRAMRELSSLLCRDGELGIDKPQETSVKGRNPVDMAIGDKQYSDAITTTEEAVISLEHANGHHIPLSEINHLHLDILCKIAHYYSDHGGNSLEHLITRGLCLKNMLRLSCHFNTSHYDLIPSALSLSDGIIVFLSKGELEDMNEVFQGHFLNLANTIKDTIAIALIERLPVVRNEFPVARYDKDDYMSLSSALRLAQLESIGQLKSSYIRGDTTLLQMIIDDIINAVKVTSHEEPGVLNLELQNFIADIITIADKLACIHKLFSPFVSNNVDSYVRFECNIAAINGFLHLFDMNGQINRNYQRAVESVEEYMLDASAALMDNVGYGVVGLNSKTICHLICIMEGQIEDGTGSLTLDQHSFLNAAFSVLYKQPELLDTSDVLYAIERCYQRFGYIHHYAVRIMINHVLSRHITTCSDALVAANVHALCFTIPYNIVSSVTYRNINRMLGFLVAHESAYRAFTGMIYNIANYGGLHSTKGVPSAPLLRNSVATDIQRNKKDRGPIERCVASSYSNSAMSAPKRRRIPPCMTYIHQGRGGTYLFRLWQLMQKTLLKG
ncbi:hypothetical protein BgAZ_109630 [Babesia gibsoni]|uniref:Uncharacterized protein n=1 Tax=Babesia gibsoni TaxID=33632 RepID=A0AAD8PH42_BABGI|nr:hypothetical protein BgAZ_109630 [Babesia gibsoni]